jgi:stage V sporulation protein R
MLQEHLYHPPFIEIDMSRSKDNCLYLNHRFEGKPLVTEYIANTMLGIEYLWGGPVQLETSEIVPSQNQKKYGGSMPERPGDNQEIQWKRIIYTMKDRNLTKKEYE